MVFFSLVCYQRDQFTQISGLQKIMLVLLCIPGEISPSLRFIVEIQIIMFSPILLYESVNCFNKYVEEMTSEECTQCKMEITEYTFITVPQLLAWAENKINVMFCVKESKDIPRAISSLLELNASHRAFLEVHLGDMLNLEQQQTPDWDQVYYVVELSGKSDLTTILAASDAVKKRAFLLEFNSVEGWDNVQDDIALAKANGFRTFSKSRGSQITATVPNHLKLFEMGIDVAYTYNLTNAVQARQIVNAKNGILPP